MSRNQREVVNIAGLFKKRRGSVRLTDHWQQCILLSHFIHLFIHVLCEL